MDRADYYRPGNDAARRAYEEGFKAQHAARKAQEAAAEMPAPDAEDAPDAERIEDGTLVEVEAGTFRAWLGTVVGASEAYADGRTWIVYALERSNGRIDYAREDRVTIVPE